MSQAHIPQPDSGNSPGEQIQSTDSVPPMQSIETLTPASPQDISAVGEFNSLDPWFYTQFRRITTVQWTTADESGKLLWWIPITPLALDKNLGYVMRLYLAWLGSFIFNFKVAGTGFHAGLLSFVKLPPTIHPTKLKNPQDYTIMPWDAVDPKMLEIGSFMGRDIRPIKYHYVQKQPNAPDDYYIGGYFALYVDMPLSTSSSGVPRINIAIWAKCAQDFRVSWMVPFNLQDVETESIAPPVIETLTNFRDHYGDQSVFMASNYEAADIMTIEPADLKVINTDTSRCFALSGTPLSGNWDGETFDQYQIFSGIYVYKIETDRTKIVLEHKKPFMNQAPAPGNFLYEYDPKEKPTDQAYRLITVEVNKSNPIQYNCTVDREMGQDVAEGAGKWYITHQFNVTPSTWVDTRSWNSPVAGESFMKFYASSAKISSVQTYDMARVFSTQTLTNWFQPNQAALFQIYEGEAQVPLGYAKLYYDGIFTSVASKDRVEYQLSRIKLNFLNLVPFSSTIPDTPIMATNRLLIADKHRRAIRASLKLKSSSPSQQHFKQPKHGSHSSSSSSGRFYD